MEFLQEAHWEATKARDTHVRLGTRAPLRVGMANPPSGTAGRKLLYCCRVKVHRRDCGGWIHTPVKAIAWISASAHPPSHTLSETG